MAETRSFVLGGHPEARQRAIEAVRTAPDGHAVKIGPRNRNLEQNAKFHAICSDLAKQLPYAGKMRSLEQWKFLLISGHAIATKEPSEIVPGLEGEFLNLRESSSRMTVARMSSLIEYAVAFCAQNQIKMSD